MGILKKICSHFMLFVPKYFHFYVAVGIRNRKPIKGSFSIEFLFGKFMQKIHFLIAAENRTAEPQKSKLIHTVRAKPGDSFNLIKIYNLLCNFLAFTFMLCIKKIRFMCKTSTV